jgi:ATP-dependent Clp protease adaptor protein ClpS
MWRSRARIWHLCGETQPGGAERSRSTGRSAMPETLSDVARMVSMPDSDSESGTPAGGTAIAERPVDEVLTQTPWVTIVWDDPVNLMSYVTHVFVTYFHYTKSKAEKLMLQVHTTGKAIVSSGAREAMERDVTAMHEYGLWATLDKSDK